MLENINIEDILFIDIETVPCYESYLEMPEEFRHLWDNKAKQISKIESETPEGIFQRAGIYAEFGKIICISVGIVKDNSARIKSFSGHDESFILMDFAEMLNKNFSSPGKQLCAHNGKEFDYPYICRRMVINGIKTPTILDLAGKKPWEVQLLDTMELWKFGDYKSYTSLVLLAAVFSIPSPKDDINGSDVARVYYEENNLERIVEYCCKDVVTIIQIFLKFQGKKLISNDNIKVII